jgi:hypothetical protein
MAWGSLVQRVLRDFMTLDQSYDNSYSAGQSFEPFITHRYFWDFFSIYADLREAVYSSVLFRGITDVHSSALHGNEARTMQVSYVISCLRQCINGCKTFRADPSVFGGDVVSHLTGILGSGNYRANRRLR